MTFFFFFFFAFQFLGGGPGAALNLIPQVSSKFRSFCRSFSSCLLLISLYTRQSLLSLHMTKSYVRTATRSTLKVEANLTQILNFKANFHTEFEPFFKKKIYANNGGHFKIVSIKIKN